MCSEPRSRTRSALAALPVWALAAAVLGGCGIEPIQGSFVDNVRPVVRLTEAPFDDGSSYFYAYRLNWLGHDPDGWVEYFEYVIDPDLRRLESIVWTRTTKKEQILIFSATRPDSLAPTSRAVDFHTFAIRAVDNRGGVSDIVMRSFFSYTVAPTVTITNPLPSTLLTAQVAPSVRITWTGRDSDGQFTTRPIGYKYKLFTSSSEFPMSIAAGNPDSLRRFYAPRFAGWDSTGGDTPEAHYTNLTPGAEYLFAVVAFDEAGAYSPIFSLNDNMLRFRVGLAGALGPRITLSSSFFNFTYATGGYSLDPSREVHVEMLADQAMVVRWGATPLAGSALAGYRWRIDGDVTDETPRADDQDVGRWSNWSLNETSALVGPFPGVGTHRLYVEAEDDNGVRSIGIVRFTVISRSVSFSKDLLIVDDTRLVGDDAGVGGCVKLPLGSWPTAAELDTFLYARGGAPWRCYPIGTQSTPGVFSGYAFDTLGTRPGTFSFSKLAEYRHVIWLVDSRSALIGGGVFGVETNVVSLRYMSTAGRLNTLAAYMEHGGRVWLAGGGAGYAATINPPRSTFVPDFFAWRSEFKSATSPLWILRSPRAVGDWAGAPAYAFLPPRLEAKTAASDPFPPGRTGQNPSVFYRSTLDIEFLSKPNRVIEDVDPSPGGERYESTLDTLFGAVGIALPGPGTNPENVVMTLYHGPARPSAVFSGFDLWNYKREQIVDLVDFVLQRVWGLPKNGPQAAARP